MSLWHYLKKKKKLTSSRVIKARVKFYTDLFLFQVLDRALFHAENSYRIPNMEVHGYLCRTNLPSNTAFRGFGGPQGMFFIESIIDEVALTVNIPQEQVSLLN